MGHRYWVSFAGLLLLLPVIGLAQAPAINSFTGASSFGSTDSTDLTLGFSFTPTVNLTVSALGVWESNTAVNLSQTHQVGLWTAGGVLLASGTIPVNGTVNGSWRYLSISPVSLTSGQTYFVGSTITSPFSDPYSRVPVAGGSVSVNPLITLGVSATSPSASGFAFPSDTNASFLARLGPNLIVAAAGSSTSTAPAGAPVSPWALGVMGLGLAAIGLLATRKRGVA